MRSGKPGQAYRLEEEKGRMRDEYCNGFMKHGAVFVRSKYQNSWMFLAPSHHIFIWAK